VDAITLTGIAKRFGDEVAVHPIDLRVPQGEFFTLVGPSGCGKTTILRMIAGLERPSAGVLEVNGREMFSDRTQRFIGPEKRGLALVFQHYALWPHMTVFQNVAFGLGARSKREVAERVGRALDLVKIGGLEGRYPGELSGGQQQRVALARELVTEPSVLLMDEPLSNLDAKLRIDMRAELKHLHRETGMTIVYVTHDQIEALTMATTMVVMREGRIAQLGTPDSVYARPASLFVAEFVGNLPFNRLPGRLGRDGAVAGRGFAWPAGAVPWSGPERDVVVGIRPEALRVREDGASLSLRTRVVSVLPAGSYTVVQAELEDGERLYVQLSETTAVRPEQPLALHVDAHRLSLFDPLTGDALHA
jgi:ABC-type sugar transport system ATPase subunit